MSSVKNKIAQNIDLAKDALLRFVDQKNKLKDRASHELDELARIQPVVSSLVELKNRWSLSVDKIFYEDIMGFAESLKR